MTQIEWDAKNVELRERMNNELDPLREQLNRLESARHEMRMRIIDINKALAEIGEKSRQTCCEIQAIKARYNHEKSIILSERPE